MYRVMLFGSGSLPSITQDVANLILTFGQQNECEFLLGDGMILDQSYNEFLSRAGLTDKVKVYGIGHIRNNKFKHEEVVLKAEYNESDCTVEFIDNNGVKVYRKFITEGLEKFTSSPKWGSMLDRCMAEQCNVAICVWNGKSKAECDIMNYLSIVGKPCYLFTIQI